MTADQHGRELQSEVLATLWATDRALTPIEIRTEIGGDLTDDTVHAILGHLCQQGLVRPVAGGGYSPVLDAAESTARVMRQVLDRPPVTACRTATPDPSLPPPRRRLGILPAARSPIPPSLRRGESPPCPHSSKP